MTNINTELLLMGVFKMAFCITEIINMFFQLKEHASTLQ